MSTTRVRYLLIDYRYNISGEPSAVDLPPDAEVVDFKEKVKEKHPLTLANVEANMLRA